MTKCAETNQKWIQNEHLSIKTLSELVLMKVSLDIQEL